MISGNHFIDVGADGIHVMDKEGAFFSNIFIVHNQFEIQRPYRYRDETGAVVPEDQQPFDNVGENAIDIKQGPGPIFITGNSIHGFRASTTGQDASGSNGAGIVLHKRARGVTLSKNWFFDNRIHLSVGKGTDSAPQQDRDTLVHNNVFGELADPNTTGDQHPIGLFILDVSNVKVFNNTFLSQYGEKVDLIGIGDTGVVELTNNAFQNGKIVVNDISRASLVADHNAWAQVMANTPSGELQVGIVGPNDVMVDNLRIDTQTWEPLENSPLIDAGASIG